MWCRSNASNNCIGFKKYKINQIRYIYIVDAVHTCDNYTWNMLQYDIQTSGNCETKLNLVFSVYMVGIAIHVRWWQQ
jgi:hypothetical protein